MESGTPKQTVLIVDDSADSIALLSSLLRGEYRVLAAVSGESALELISRGSVPDLILLDVMMPGMDGYEVCARLKFLPSAKDTPIIFLTARNDAVDEERGLTLGAVDYITKPFSPSIVRVRIATQLRLKSVRDFLEDKAAFLEDEVARRTKEVGMIQDVTMAAMGSLAETRDNETGNHIRRTQHYIKVLAEQLAMDGRYRPSLSGNAIELLYKSAPLHDIGKVGIPDEILKKPGQLTPGEFEIMKRHTLLGREAILAAESRLDSPTSFLSYARDIAWSHHEKWDGSGYPRGLSGESIPLSGRLMAIPDVYDALISRRVYKAPLPHEEAIAIIAAAAGKQFDPEIAAAFLRIEAEVKVIARSFSDH